MRDIGRHILAHSLRRGDVARGHDVAFTGKKCAESPLRETAAGRLHVIRDARGRRQWFPALSCAALLICCEVPARAGSADGTFVSGTFINSARPDYNNGGATSLYLGEDFYGGFMRCLIRFDLPPSFTERTSISGATLSLTTGALTGGNPAAATVYVQRLTESWGQGNGAGPDPITGDYTYGQLCSVGGATWNQPFCSGVTWSTIGGSADATLSGSASSPATPASVVQWNSAGMASDVQSWVDTPSSNHGWRLRSSSEGTLGAVQRFFNPQLSISYGCKNGFEEIAGSCTTCTTAAESACVTSQADNDCNDSGPPSTTYSCTCNNPAYVGGPGGTSCIDRNECVPNHCADDGDAAAICTDHAAPSTGFSCICSAGFVFSGGTCAIAIDDEIFKNGFEAPSA